MNATMNRLRMSRTISSIVIPPPWPIAWAIWALSAATGAPALRRGTGPGGARAADDGRLLVTAEVARDDLTAARAAEPFDERPDVVRAQGGLVVVDGHGLRARVRLGV